LGYAVSAMEETPSTAETPITTLLNNWAAQPAAEDSVVFSLVYDRLHDIAAAHFAKQGRHRILQTTAVLNEAFLRLARTPKQHPWQDREHFFAYSSHIMRHVLVDFAKHSNRVKRGSGAIHITLEEPRFADDESRCDDVLAVHQALSALETIDAERARVVELRYFGGLTPPEIAATLGLSEATVHRRWRLARAWLFDFLHPGA